MSQPEASVDAQSRRRLALVGYVASLTVQIVMVVLGIGFIITEDPFEANVALGLWCVLGTLYAVVALVILGRIAKRSDQPQARRPSRLEIGRPARIVSFTATILASFVGLGAATQVLALSNDPSFGVIVDLLGVWAMLLSWGFLHWGFAQVYYQDYYAADPPPLRFPQTPRPRIVDFVYFSFTLGTSFAASDVETLSTRLRWRVVWHSVLSFFFNGLIIVLALNTIMDIGK